jgi:hypothetical protein
MNDLTRMAGCLVALLLGGCAHDATVAVAQNSVGAEFVGSTLGEPLVREFLGGLASNAPCHSITWQLALSTNQNSRRPSTFDLAVLYRIPTRHNTNQSEDGPKVKIRGTWEIVKDAESRASTVIYRIHAEQPERSLSFVQVSENLLHLLNPDGSLAVGDGGWSYTLNRAARSEKLVDASLVMSAPDMSYNISSLATGPEVFAVFEGRSPCHGIARELKLPQHAGCSKVKWRVTLFQDPQTSAPATYKVEGSLFRRAAREGTWTLSRGSATEPNAIIYQLNATQTQPALFLLKGDDNVLFILDQNRVPMVGHQEFSYTLNRVAAK